MLLIPILALLYVSTAEELSVPGQVEEFQAELLRSGESSTNCSYILHSEETTTDSYSTFPTTSFTCWGRYDGYYADTEVDCTIFHYCQTWQFPTGLNETVKWDFACPQSTIFNQKILSCTPPNISFDCQESPNYFWVNYNLTWTTEAPTTEFSTPLPNVGQQLIVGGAGSHSATFSDSTASTVAGNVASAEPEESASGSELSSSVAVNRTGSGTISFPR